MTPSGKIILDMVNGSSQHLTAEAIYQMLQTNEKKMSLATVYNNLNSLCEEGFIKRLSIEGKPDYYDKVTRHDHLICKKCGKIFDLTLDDMTKDFEKKIGVSLESYDLKLYYICEDCKGKVSDNG
ncbi:MAG: Fur family transcriptional regulator [Acutalibacteraceae bacterium]